MAENVILKTQILLRNDTAVKWTAANPVLGQGEVGLETDTKKLKVGDGTTAWNSLDYYSEAATNTHYEVYSKSDLDNIPEEGLIRGDTAVVRTTIAIDPSSETPIFSYTAYVWNGTAWAAMDGNYNASNVYFDENLTYTANIGALTLGDQNSKVIESAGMSLEALIKKILAETKPAVITQPTYTNLKAKATYSNGLELGSKITAIGWTADSTPGSYSYGSVDANGENKTTSTTPGITRTYRVRCNGVEIGTTEDSASNVTLASPITIDSENSKTYANLWAVMSWGNDTRKPINNIGELSGTRISGDSIVQTATLTLTGYREGCFYGCFTDNARNANNLSSADIRSLSKSGKAYAKNSTGFALSVPAGTKTIAIACPVGKTGPSDVLNTTVNAPMTTLYGTDQIAGQVTVTGADDTAQFEASYNVWLYTPANEYSNPAKLTVKLG